jgi:hypothetical protein
MSADRIARDLGDPDGLDFESLRRDGVSLLQSLSGQRWTDYNLHDPGVTLLEMLCYGLTDLAYRTGFDVADYLTGPDGAIDFAGQALFTPPAILPNAPVTDIDFCKLIYDQLPAVDDVWLTPGSAAGLFAVFVKPRESLFHAREVSDGDLRLAVLALLAQHRNLGRDVEQVHIVASRPYMMAGDIEIDDSRPAAELYADLYFQCAKLVSSGGRIVRFEEARARGMPWEDLLEGLLTTHGYIEDGHFATPNDAIDAITLIALARHIPGVKQVRKLCLLDEEGREIDHVRQDPAGAVCPVLALPPDPAMAQRLRLVQGGAPEPALQGRQAQQFLEQVRLYVKKREFEHDAFRSHDGQLARLLDLPHGQYRPLDEYGTVAEHTPSIYGINHDGVPASAPADVQARALQLKAYLYPFEQMMANYVASLQGIKRLYSLDATLGQTYFARHLDHHAIPKLQMLYRDGVDAAGTMAVLRGQDPFGERRNRVLDSMLAMYGEVFPDDALRRHDLYHADALDRHLIACKIGLLRHLCDLGARRGNGIDVQQAYGDGANVAPIQLRVQLLSGGDPEAVGRSLTAGLLHGHVEFLSDARYQGRLAQLPDYPQDVRDDQTVPLQSGADAPALRPPATPLPHGAVAPAVLVAGIHHENYRVLADGGEHGWLCLQVADGACWPIVRLPRAALAAAGRHMREALVDLNRGCEGFHLVEHVLLRPREAGTARAVPDEFYAHRVSVILPGFTARYADAGCRAWIEQLIAQHVPAHLLPQFYWLSVPLLAQFELRQASWLELLRAAATGQGADGLDAAAERVIDFLAEHAPAQDERVWL